MSTYVEKWTLLRDWPIYLALLMQYLTAEILQFANMQNATTYKADDQPLPHSAGHQE